MRSTLQSMLVVMTALGLLAPADSIAQSPNSTSPETVLEVMAIHATVASEDRYVYLRVFSEGTTEVQYLKSGDAGTNERPTIKKTLTQDEFAQIKCERYVKCRGYGLGGTGIPRAAHRAI
jgi:hypothetical protein